MIHGASCSTGQELAARIEETRPNSQSAAWVPVISLTATNTWVHAVWFWRNNP